MVASGPLSDTSSITLCNCFPGMLSWLVNTALNRWWKNISLTSLREGPRSTMAICYSNGPVHLSFSPAVPKAKFTVDFRKRTLLRKLWKFIRWKSTERERTLGVIKRRGDFWPVTRWSSTRVNENERVQTRGLTSCSLRAGVPYAG